MTEDYDAKVERLVLRHFTADANNAMEVHMVVCPSLRVTGYDSRGSRCDSGCESTTLEAELSCDHYTTEFEYGVWGDLDYLIQELEEDE